MINLIYKSSECPKCGITSDEKIDKCPACGEWMVDIFGLEG